jgi:hypothetical protein
MCRWSSGAAVWRGLARGQQGPARGVPGDGLARAAAARRDAGQERTRFGSARKRRGKTGVSVDPATGEGGGAMQSTGVQGNDVQSGGEQRMAVSPLRELRPRPSWCAGRSRTMREELQCEMPSDGGGRA